MIYINFTHEDVSWKNDGNFFNKSVYISLPSELYGSKCEIHTSILIQNFFITPSYEIFFMYYRQSIVSIFNLLLIHILILYSYATLLLIVL